MNAQAVTLIIKFWHDEWPEDPCDTDGWKVTSFSSRHGNSAEPYEVGFELDDEGTYAPNKDLQAKLDAGLAFLLDYFEHGQCVWSLAGSGPQCRWDTSRFAGILIWEQDEDDMGAKTVEDRTKDATAFLERYTQWSNGEVYGYTIEPVTPCPTCGNLEETSEVDFDIPSCGGYFGDSLDYMLSDMKDHIGADWADYEVRFEERQGYGLADEAKRRWKKEA